MSADQPLRCTVEGEELVIRIGINTLAWAEQSERRDTPFWTYDEEKYEYVPRWKIINDLEWAKDVVREINREEEDGSSLLTNLLDKASDNALDQGSLAVWGPELGISEEEAIREARL
jgi:hypothetical protein